MTRTISAQNVAGTNSDTGFFYFGTNNPNPLIDVKIGWFAQGEGVVNGLVTNVVVDPGASVITIEYPQVFLSGASYYFTSPIPCFKEDTNILCLRNNFEKYIPVQNLRKGDLVKTLNHGYLPIYMIGKKKIYNANDTNRISERLYKCSKQKYPELFDDLIITGSHSILVDFLTPLQMEKTKQILNDVFITDKKYRLMAVVDDRAETYNMEGWFNVYHFALENEDYYMNYGVYANGLLVETCSKRYLSECSDMELY